jgi:transposase
MRINKVSKKTSQLAVMINCHLEYKFSGKRIKRGLYQSKDGIKFNADVNGSLNILRKSKKTDFNNFKIENIFTVKRINVLKVV